MSFVGFLTTEKGQNLLTKLLSGENLVLSRVSGGSGLCLSRDIAVNLSDLIYPEMEGTSTIPSFSVDSVGLTLEFRSDMLSGDGFFLSEYGIFALDPDEGEILLYYASLGDNPQYITGSSGKYATVLRYDVSIAVGEDFESELCLSYPASAFVRHEEMAVAFLEHNQDLSAHEGLFGKIVDELESLESSFGNSLEELETSLEEMGTKEHVHDASDVTTGVFPLVRGGLGNSVGQAVTANSLTTARNLSVNLATSTSASFNGTGNAVLGVNGVLPVANGGTGSSSGVVSSATSANTAISLATARTIRTDLASTSTASFDGTSNITPGVTGILPLGNGGTGATTAGYARKALELEGYCTGTYTLMGSGAGGYSTKTTAVGFGAIAAGSESVALGVGAYAGSGSRAVALGADANAYGMEAAACGYSSSAYGLCSTALGCHATTSTSEVGYIQIGESGFTNVVRIATTALTTTSDMRDKADISPVSDSLEFLSKIQPMGYVMNYRSDYEEDFSQELDELEKKEKGISENSENSSKNPKNTSEIGKENSQVEMLSLEEKTRLDVLKERKRKRNTYGRGDYDRISHEKGEKKGKRRRIGVLAQEVQQAMLDQYGTDNYADLVIDNLYGVEDVPEGMESSLGVNYSNFIPFLIDGVNRLYLENQEMKARLSILEGNLSDSGK